jgi:hypothetical protein
VIDRGAAGSSETMVRFGFRVPSLKKRLSARTTFTRSIWIWNFPGFLSLSMKPSPLIWLGSTGPMPCSRRQPVFLGPAQPLDGRVGRHWHEPTRCL